MSPQLSFCRSVIGCFLALLMFAFTSSIVRSQQESPQAPDEQRRCDTLASADFSTVQDAPTQITEAKFVSATSDLPAHCLVRGYVSPNVGFEILLPTLNWNGKYLQVGCGGFCGSSNALPECSDALRRNYACVASDMGHRGAGLD